MDVEMFAHVQWYVAYILGRWATSSFLRGNRLQELGLTYVDTRAENEEEVRIVITMMMMMMMILLLLLMKMMTIYSRKWFLSGPSVLWQDTPGFNPMQVHVRYVVDPSGALGQFYLPVPHFCLVVVIPPLLHTSLRLLLLSEGQAGGSWVPSKQSSLAIEERWT
jgi:hypothetical protein